MILGKVVATVVATEKQAQLLGRKLLMVQPLDGEGRARGRPLVAVDGAQAGIGDRVLVVDEGGSARSVLGDEGALTIRTVILGVVDRVDIEAEE